MNSSDTKDMVKQVQAWNWHKMFICLCLSVLETGSNCDPHLILRTFNWELFQAKGLSVAHSPFYIVYIIQ